MKIVGVGVDLCSVARMGAALERTRGLLQRLFTPGEQEVLGELRAAHGDGARDTAAAQMFAAKEAVMKSLGVGFDTVAFNSVHVDLHGPVARLDGAGTGRAAESGARSFALEVDLLEGPEGQVAVAEVLALG